MSRIKPPQKKPHLVRKPGPSLRVRMSFLKDKKLVKGLREHPLLGRGTESIVDQCFTDEELLEELGRERITTLPEAIQHFAIWEGLDIDDLIDADQENKDAYISEEATKDKYDDDDPVWWREWDDYQKNGKR